jgi:hypothetical protein
MFSCVKYVESYVYHVYCTIKQAETIDRQKFLLYRELIGGVVPLSGVLAIMKAYGGPCFIVKRPLLSWGNSVRTV